MFWDVDDEYCMMEPANPVCVDYNAYEYVLNLFVCIKLQKATKIIRYQRKSGSSINLP